MATKNIKIQKRTRLKKRIRSRITGVETRPRLSVFKSNNFIYAQLIDDTSGKTLVSVSDMKETTGTKVERATKTGTAIAALAKAKGVSAVVFDRSGFKYTGRVKALADGARAGGLQF
jgi:large subunit ribosomal protein L18